ncbi:MAG: hypothetical protein DRJ67_07230 [Thermoprotei archaeon]|nr:MAG: hypothetical protein DRJ67_07230 [Thermoprotei archaeon]
MKLVWDTSSLSHAFEEFSHAAASAYMRMRGARTWRKLKGLLLKRISSEARSRRLLLDCDVNECLIPLGVYREVAADPHFTDSLDLLTGYGRRVEERYKEKDIAGFAATFKPRLVIKTVRPSLVDYVLVRAREMGLDISRADAEGVALAIEQGAVLVTADGRQARVARSLGVRVIYTIGGKYWTREKKERT